MLGVSTGATANRLRMMQALQKNESHSVLY
jgi:hypothetical protein